MAGPSDTASQLQALAALQNVTAAISGAATPEQVGQAVAEHGARALDGSGGVVFALEDGLLRVIGRWGDAERFLQGRTSLPLAARTPSATAARERRTVAAASFDPFPDISARPSQAVCGVPLLAGDEVLGALGVSRPEPFDDPELELLEALAGQSALALERARLYRRQQLVNDRLHRLQTVTAGLARALTPSEVAATAAAQGAEALGASTAWVALMDASERSLELAHAAGHEPETRARFASLPLDAALPLSVAARTATPIWLESPEAIFGSYPRFAEVRPQAQSAALLPLVDDGAVLGAIGLVFDFPVVFTADDRDYLVALTRLCGQALGRARRYQAEHDLAATLQHALLPESLPRADGLELAVRYLPAADGTAAGGDFYDAIELPGGRLGIAVGDVVGHGPAAAAAMGQLRSALRAYALEARPPARVMQLLSRYADGVSGARGATLAYAVLDPGAHEVRYCCAGHPPPLLVSPNGDTRFLEGARGVPLDRALGQVYEDTTALVTEGSTLILYSDGAVERRGEALDVGMGRLAVAASTAARLTPEALCSAVLDALFEEGRHRRDDVALLAARALPLMVAPLHLWFLARADQLAVVRQAMRTWLAGAAVDPGDAELVVLAAGELCANSVEHAYAPDVTDAAVEVALAREPGGVLTLVVRDRGRWRPPPADPGFRGRGLNIVRALMHAVDVDEGADGTTVSTRYKPGGAPPITLPEIEPAAIEVDRSAAVPVARLRGEIDGANADALEPALLELAPGPVIVDLSELAFLASAGLRVLFGLANKCVRIAVVAPVEAPFRRALDVAELSKVAYVADSPHEALEHFAL
ncbi:SpoIIE family protein phosphatase [Solirubrobacter soli]|uniref:SpoIIE family protein phosphatase n=1 Tax=Solirubrobacter soli TaxID=363832 RepID=UPI000428E33B|nr:SpoIIE family protein phosphatase [Solirubrobacter soli]